MERLSALHRALNRDEFRLYFQPKVDAVSHAVVAHEVLLRWIRPSGIVSPLDFIPLAEASGLIMPIGRWVLRQAVSALTAGAIQEVCVNVSALEFRQPDFVDHLRWVLQDSGVNPSRLLLELTESSLLEPRFISALHELKALGVRTALDDFGNGYSSLMALVSLPIEMVKIDRSFTADIGKDTPGAVRALDVLRGIVTLATAYGLPTVAEGVETQEQADLLTTAGWRTSRATCSDAPSPCRDSACITRKQILTDRVAQMDCQCNVHFEMLEPAPITQRRNLCTVIRFRLSFTTLNYLYCRAGQNVDLRQGTVRLTNTV